jgi:hypothetical protein
LSYGRNILPFNHLHRILSTAAADVYHHFPNRYNREVAKMAASS